MLTPASLSQTISLDDELGRLRGLAVYPVSLQNEFGLRPSEERIVRAILSVHPKILTRDDLYFRVHGKRHYEGNALDVQISRLRKMLRQHGLVIKSFRGTGYGFSEETVRRLMKIVGAEN